jgi:Peptidase inhibitor I9
MQRYYSRHVGLALLLLTIMLAAIANAQIAEQDDAGRVSVRAGEDTETSSGESDTTAQAVAEPVDDQPVANTDIPSYTAWKYSLADELPDEQNAVLEVMDIQGTKEFIIVYKEPDVDDIGIAEEIISVTDFEVQSMVMENGGAIVYEYSTAFNGISADLTNEALQELMKQENIEYIEEVVPMYISEEWGLDRIDQPNLPLNDVYRFKDNPNAGRGINVCVSHHRFFLKLKRVLVETTDSLTYRIKSH